MTKSREGSLTRLAAAGALGRGPGAPVRALLARPFPPGARRRVAVVYEPRRIAFAQVYPFLVHARDFRAQSGAAFSFVPTPAVLDGALRRLAEADTILLQTWFDIAPERLEALLAQIRRENPGVRLVYLDCFAPNDLRLAGTLAPHVDLYLKKSLFRERARHLEDPPGGTNLTAYYAALFGLDAPAQGFAPPAAILGRLRLSPGFFTAPGLMGRFLGPAPVTGAARAIDVHARLAARGPPWYAKMRGLALERLGTVPGLVTTTGTGVPWRTYMRELADSKMCFSPFGYGELCWRDIEAFLTGAVLIKPDMSHLETLPELYRPCETYVPCRWDFADLPERIAATLADAPGRQRIAAAAFETVAGYLREGRFVADMSDVVA